MTIKPLHAVLLITLTFGVSFVIVNYQEKSTVGSIVSKVIPHTQLAQAAPTSGLVAYYTFDEGSGTTANDTSGSGNSAAISGSPIWTTGRIGGALDFEDNNAVANTVTDFIGAGDMTITAWIKPSQLGTPSLSTSFGVMISNDHFKFSTDGRGNNSLDFRNNNNTLSGSAPNTIATSTWAFAVVTRTGSTIHVYVNGVDNWGAQTNDAPAAGTYIAIGNRRGNDQPFKGIIDDLRIYNRVLSPSEIAQVYAYTGSGGGTPADTTAPSVPTNLSATAISSSQINLTWTVSTDNTAVTGYKVYRNGIQVGTPSTNSYSDTGLTASTQYAYNVSAYDAANNNSSQTAAVTATTQSSGGADTTPPVVSSINAGSVTSSSATITWNTDESSDSQVEYGLTTSYGSLTSPNSTLVTSHSVSLSSLSANTLYHYRVKSKDAAGNLTTGGDNMFTAAAVVSSTYTLTISKSGAGNGTVTGGSVSCGSTCSQAGITSGTSINLTASASSGSTFTGWSGGGCSGTGTCVVMVTGDVIVGAGFGTSGGSGGNQVDRLNSSGSVLATYTTIQACANAAIAGQKCLVYAGSYDERVIPPNSGSVGNPITFLSSSGAKVKAFTLQNKNFITIQGFEITHAGFMGESGSPNYISPGSSISASIFMQGTNNIQINNNNIHDTSGICIYQYATGISDASNNALIQGNTISHCGNQAGSGWTAGNGITVYGNYNRVENNDISHIGEDFIRMIGGDYNVIRNNNFHDNSHSDGPAGDITHIDGVQNWSTAGYLCTHHLLIENNTMTNAPSPDTHFTIFQDYAPCGESDMVIRGNTINGIGESFIINDKGVQNVRIYNNTAYNLGLEAKADPSIHNWGDVGFNNGATGGRSINNIFVNTVYHPGAGSGGNENVVDTSSASGFYGNNNLAYDTSCTTSCSWNNPAQGLSSEPNSIINQNPLFVSIGFNFNLQVSSPAIDRGGYLTQVVSGDTGNGTILKVNDAGFFQDGWTGVSSDWIAVGSASNVAQISSINYTTNTITLASSLTRSVGASVWLYKNSSGSQVLYGSAPDIGSYEYAGSGGGGGPTDTTPPSIPTSLSATAISASAVNLTWTASTDNVAVTGYKVYRNGTQIGTTATNSYSDTGLIASTLYSYTVSAYDAAVNNSSQSSSASATTQSAADITAPTVSITSPSNGSTVSGSITISSVASDNVGVVGVQWKLDGVNLGSELTTAPYSGSWNTNGVSNGSHTLTAVARDAAGNTKTSSTVTVTVNNVIPTYTLSASRSGSGDGTITGGGLSCGTTCVTTVNTGTSVTLTATPLTGSTFSGWSGSCSGSGTCTITISSNTNVTAAFALIPDTQAPTAPTALAPSSLTQTTVTISWSASADNVGVTGYNLYRNGTLIASPTTNTYAVSGLSANTLYTFTASAYDNAGNTSSLSSPLSIITSPIPVTTYTLTSTKGGTGSGTISGNGLNCGSTCTASVTQGTSISLTATPSADSTFDGWTAVCTGSGTCNTTISGNTTIAAIFTLIPSTTGGGNDTGGNTGGGGGGGNTYVPPPITGTFTPTVTQAPAVTSNTSNSVAVTTPCTSSSSSSFTRSLTTGADGADVKALQVFLNNKGFTVATSGAGSKGNETSYFGPATTRAVAAFQLANNINPPAGYFGPLTMKAVNALLGTTSSCPTTNTVVPTITTTSSSFTRDLQLGDDGLDVKALQVYLNTHGFPVATTGYGSLGNETEHFGPATVKALGLFQAAHGIVPPAGYFGPKTRANIEK